MVDIFSYQELAEKAPQELEKWGVNALYATEDGYFFISENRAKLHAVTGKFKVHAFYKKGYLPDPAPENSEIDERSEQAAGKGKKTTKH